MALDPNRPTPPLHHPCTTPAPPQPFTPPPPPTHHKNCDDKVCERKLPVFHFRSRPPDDGTRGLCGARIISVVLKQGRGPLAGLSDKQRGNQAGGGARARSGTLIHSPASGTHPAATRPRAQRRPSPGQTRLPITMWYMSLVRPACGESCWVQLSLRRASTLEVNVAPCDGGAGAQSGPAPGAFSETSARTR
ncbi:unnamed protein product [Arctogadus glacialis]